LTLTTWKYLWVEKSLITELSRYKILCDRRKDNRLLTWKL